MKHTKQEHMKYNDWMAMLSKIAEAHYCFEITSFKSWAFYYDNGFSPREALDDSEFNR